MANRGFIKYLALAGVLLFALSDATRADAPWLFVPTIHYETHEPLYSVFVVNPRSNAIDREIPVDGRMNHTRVNADRTLMYATSADTQQLLVFDATRGVLAETVALDFEPLDLTLDEANNEIYLISDTPPRAYVLDLDTFETIRQLELEPGEPTDIMLHTHYNLILVRQRGPGTGADWPIHLYDAQSGDWIDSYGEGDANDVPLFGREYWSLLSVSDQELRIAIITPNGFTHLSSTALPLFPFGMVADWTNLRLYLRSESELQVVDLFPLLVENPTDSGDVLLESIELFPAGTLSVDPDNNRLYMAQPLQISPVAPPPPFGEPPTDESMEVHTLRAAPLGLLNTYDTEIIGGATSRGPFLAGEALPNAPAIPALGPAGIGVLIVAMMAMAIRRYRLRVPTPSGPRP